jgi:hypothetical protein
MLTRSGKKPSPGVEPGDSGLKTVREHESQDDGGEGDAFDQSGGDQHVGADASGGFRLTGRDRRR